MYYLILIFILVIEANEFASGVAKYENGKVIKYFYEDGIYIYEPNFC